MKNRKFYWKLFTSFLILIIIYTFVTTSVFYSKNNQIFQNERKNNHEALLKQVKEKIDKRLEFAFQSTLQLESEEIFKEYSKNTSDEPDHYQLLQVKKLLQNNLSLYSQFDYKLGIMKINHDIIITPANTISKDQYFKKLGLSKIDRETINKFSQDQKGILGNYKVLAFSDGERRNSSNITLVKKEMIDRHQNVLFFVTFSTKTFYPDTNALTNESFGIVKDSDIVNFKTNMKQSEISQLLTKDYLNKIKEKVGTKQTSLIQKSNYNINSVRSDILKDWNYIYITPKNGLISSMPNLLISSIAVFLSLLIIGVVFTRLILKRTYSPIGNLVGLLKGDHGSGEDEFLVIENAIKKLKSANEDLRKTIQNNQISLKNKFFRDLLMGIIDKEEIHSQVQKFNIKELKDAFRIVIFEFNYDKRLQESLSQEGSMALKLQAFKLLKEQIGSKAICDIVELDYEKVVILIKEREIESVKKWIHSFVYHLNEDINFSIMAAVSELVIDIEQTELMFKNTMNLFEYRFAMEKTPILTMDDVKHLVNTNYYYPLNVERELIDSTLRGEDKEAIIILDRVLEENLYNKNLNYYALSQFVIAIIVTISRILQTMNKSVHDILDEDLSSFFEIKKIEDKTMLEKKIRSTFHILLSQIRSKNEQENISMADQLTAFIQDHYDKDISLTDMAEHFNLTSSYISTIFKTNMGENFKEFLNRYRINKAKEILESESVKINQLAGMVGYNNVNTFIRIFKKYVGLSPGQYEAMRLLHRNLNMKDNS
ncbi:AraC family transcriptional regulator [Neobacillus drentensis]|uniref:helix-turn-helix domain-containing protein n=1 Tax=Neobacillus drentensis TaxID=220684 RepID=UPI002FFEE724